jgi:hypothetical protein
MSNNTFETSAQVLEWLISLCKPMIENETPVQGTGICNIAVSQNIIDTLLIGGGIMNVRTEDKQNIYLFTRNGKIYTIKVMIAKSNMKRITFKFDHRTEAVTPEGETEMFKFYYRDLSDRMTLEMQPWEAINNYRMMDGKWQVQKQIGDRWVIIAESKNWHFESVSEKMQRQINPRPKLSSRLVNGLLVETETEPNVTRTRIYFQSTKDPVFSPHIKICNGTHISLEGNVTIENYGGYLQASEMAVHMLWS